MFFGYKDEKRTVIVSTTGEFSQPVLFKKRGKAVKSKGPTFYFYDFLSSYFANKYIDSLISTFANSLRKKLIN